MEERIIKEVKENEVVQDKMREDGGRNTSTSSNAEEPDKSSKWKVYAAIGAIVAVAVLLAFIL